jgi:hypothetical protein
LNGVRIGLDKDIHGFGKVLNAAQKVQFIKKSMINGNVDTALGIWVKQPVKTKILHMG